MVKGFKKPEPDRLREDPNYDSKNLKTEEIAMSSNRIEKNKQLTETTQFLP